ncbi:MAG: hypothetical protein HY688_03965 [Chloroflexi bacterium]|nr:hypothetical protein [Chloroflexota bacterium]
MLTSLLRILAGLGLARERAGEVQEAWELLVRMHGEVGPAAPVPGNGAKGLAQRLRGRVPVIYGAGPLAPVARRWKTQINENAKAWAFAEELPEAHHNSVVGWGLPADLRDRLFVVLLVPSRASPRVLLRLQITLELLKSAAVPYEAVQARGESELAQVLTATLYGDYISYYLALLNGVDPTPLPNVDRIKRRLQEE